MTRGRTKRGRERARRGLIQLPRARPLIRGVDHGPGLRLDGSLLGASGDRWVEPFLEANRTNLGRLRVGVAVETRGGVALRLTPKSRIGAVPLLSPVTRRVAAGLLLGPRFHWSALGAVLGEIGFRVEPRLGGAPLVPGSAREVPMWLLAAAVVRRLEPLLQHRKRSFTERNELRDSPRGRVDWTQWASQLLPSARWTSLPCSFPEPDDDSILMAAVRWTLRRLDEELSVFEGVGVARRLRERVSVLQDLLGAGPERRPEGDMKIGLDGVVADAAEAMSWVAESRGLGGARVLDGMSWDLPVDGVWEAWVDAFVAELAPRCGLSPLRSGETSRSLNWSTATRSMRRLVPDSGLRGRGRLVWVDAKYKAHLQLLSRRGWSGLSESVRSAHRADLHQALAYAALGASDRVDSLLVYPSIGAEQGPAVATVASGRRRVRLILVGLPFGFRSPDHREQTLQRWRSMLAV